MLSNGRVRVLGVVLGSFLFLLSGPVRAEAPEPHLLSVRDLQGRLERQIKDISAFGSRVPGYPGHEKAEKLIISEFEKLDLQNITIDEFELTVPLSEGAGLRSPDLPGQIELHPFWPNSVRCVTTAPEGLTGKIIYVGRGDYPDYNGHEVMDSIVLMDFDSGANYLKARDLGAQAILFFSSGSGTNYQGKEKVLPVPLNIPRLFVPSKSVEILKGLAKKGATVTVTSRMTWQKVKCRNIYAEQPGTDPNRSDEKILLTSYYDSSSVVPSLAPGAEQSTGMVAMLELAKHLHRHRPLRPVAYLMTTGHGLANIGMRDFLVRHCSGDHYKFHMAKLIDLDPVPIPQEKDLKPALIFALDLSSRSRSLLALFEASTWRATPQEDLIRRNMLSQFGKVLREHSDRLSNKHEWQPFFLNGISPEQGTSRHSHLPIALLTDGDEAGQYGHRAISLVSGRDARAHFDTPFDTPEVMDFPSLALQVRNLAALLETSINDPDFFELGNTKVEVPAGSIRAKRGLQVSVKRAKIGKDPIPTMPLPGALVVSGTAPHPDVVGQRGVVVGIADQDGECIFPFSPGSELEGYKLDPDDGKIIYAADRGSQGAGTFPLTPSGQKAIVVLFRCRPIDLIGAVEPNRMKNLDKLSVFDHRDTSLQEFGYTINKLVTDRTYTAGAAPVATIFVRPNQRVKIALGLGFWGYQYLLLNADEENPFGKGLEMTEGDYLLYGDLLGVSDEDMLNAEGQESTNEKHDFADRDNLYYTDLLSASDMAMLNKARKDTLEKYGISNNLMKELLAKGDLALDRAVEALRADQKDYAAYANAIREARSYQTAAYPLLKETANDTVKGVIFYFALLIPFSFFCERLFFCFVDIKKQLAATAGIFVLIFLVLRLVHPAFQISMSPYMIFMAFIILTLGVGLLAVIVSKFNTQMAILRRASSGVHTTDVGRLSATVVAILLGISNMKNRKLRTLLTTTTVVLLMFTVVSFMSVDTYTSYIPIPVAGTPAYRGLLFRDRLWDDMAPAFQDYVSSAFSWGTVSRRCWFYSEVSRALAHPLTHDQQECSVSALVGMDPTEPAVSGFGSELLAGRWVTDANDRLEIIITSDAAKALGISTEAVNQLAASMNEGSDIPSQVLADASLNTLGQDFLVVGIIDSELVSSFLDLDNEPVTPLEHAIVAERTASTELAKELESQRSSTLKAFKHIPGDRLAFLNYSTLLELGGRRKSVAIRPPDDMECSEVSDSAKGFLERTNALIFDSFSSEEDRSYAFSAIGATKVSGLLALIVPMLIAGSIVVNAIMGSVHERTGEIGVYSSVGLAPVHISALFLAESSVYAVLGAILGYLLGQTVAKVAVVNNLLTGINLNYSSMAVVLGSLLVMAVVLLSAIYPSRMAAKLAVPDVTRRWVFPAPQGDLWQFDFPFTVSDRQVMSLFAFLDNYFDSYKDASVGAFHTRDVILSSEPHERGEVLVLSMKVWLRPFDLGVSQEVVMKALPTEESGISRIEVLITRRTGEYAAWQRFNSRFMREIRKQFLIYRTIPDEQKEKYAAQGRELLGLEQEPHAV